MKETISRNSGLAQLKLKDLILFDTLFRTRSLTDSAALLELTVPSAGRMLNKIREAFDDPLFTRGGSGLVPTERAIQLQKKFEHIIDVFDAFDDGEVFYPKKLNRNFTVGIADNALAELMPVIINELFEKAPNISISFQAIDNTLYERLKTGELDCAILPDFALPDDSFHKLIIGRGSCALYVRKDHPLDIRVCEKKPVYIHHIDEWPQIRICVRSLKGRLLGSIDQGLFHGQGNRRTIIELPYFFSSVELLEKSDCTLVLPNHIGSFAVKHFPIVEIPIEDATNNAYKLSLVWHDRTHNDAGSQFFRATVVNGAMKKYDTECS